MNKFLLSMIIASIVFSGCSGKYPAMKTGAIIGGTSATIAAIAVGAQDTNSDYASAIAVAVVIIGLAGTALGAGIGYTIDTINNDKEIEEMIQTEKMMEKL